MRIQFMIDWRCSQSMNYSYHRSFHQARKAYPQLSGLILDNLQAVIPLNIPFQLNLILIKSSIPIAQHFYQCHRTLKILILVVHFQS